MLELIGWTLLGSLGIGLLIAVWIGIGCGVLFAYEGFQEWKEGRQRRAERVKRNQ